MGPTKLAEMARDFGKVCQCANDFLFTSCLSEYSLISFYYSSILFASISRLPVS